MSCLCVYWNYTSFFSLTLCLFTWQAGNSPTVAPILEVVITSHPYYFLHPSRAGMLKRWYQHLKVNFLYSFKAHIPCFHLRDNPVNWHECGYFYRPAFIWFILYIYLYFRSYTLIYHLKPQCRQLLQRQSIYIVDI